MAEISTKYSPTDASTIATEILPLDPPSPETSDFIMRDLIQQLQTSDDYRDQIVPNGNRSFPEHLAKYGMHKFLILSHIHRRSFPAHFFGANQCASLSTGDFKGVQPSSKSN